MRKPSNTLLEAMDQMEQIPGIAGAWSEVRCQTHHTKPMRKTDWAFITSSGWLYVNTEREASCPEWVYILSHCCLHLALGHIREDRKTDAVWEHACDCIAAKMLLDLRTTGRVCRSATCKRERGNSVLSLAAGASDCQGCAIFHNDRWQNRYDLRLDAVRPGLDPAFCRGSAMVDPADAARLRRWTNGTAMHVPPGRAGKVVVPFLLSAAGGCCSAVPPDRRQRCRFTARCQHCGSILPYGRNLYQSVCRTAHRGMALCSST